jgi:acyl dehydratase
MTAFDIYLNGRKRCTAGIDAAGVVVSAITWTAGESHEREEDLELRVSGLISRAHTHVDWFHRPLKTGDEVKIVVVEKAKSDRPKRSRRENLTTRAKREREYVEKKAAEFGWKIVR